MIFILKRVGYKINKKINEVDFYKDRDAQIEAIDRTFRAAQNPVINHNQNIFTKDGSMLLPTIYTKRSISYIIF